MFIADYFLLFIMIILIFHVLITTSSFNPCQILICFYFFCRCTLKKKIGIFIFLILIKLLYFDSSDLSKQNWWCVFLFKNIINQHSHFFFSIPLRSVKFTPEAISTPGSFSVLFWRICLLKLTNDSLILSPVLALTSIKSMLFFWASLCPSSVSTCLSVVRSHFVPIRILHEV